MKNYTTHNASLWTIQSEKSLLPGKREMCQEVISDWPLPWSFARWN